MKKVRFAVIGTNFITDRILLNSRRCTGFELKAVYSRTEERAREYAQKNGAELTFTSLEELAACREVDAVYIGSPNYCHASQAITMLKGKKHVLCEKPICANSRELEEMFQAAGDNHVVLLEAMRPWYTPGFQYLKSILPQIGPVRHAVLQFCQYSSRYDNFKNGIVENAFKRELCNGALMDVGCYAVGVMTGLFGMPEKVAAMSRIIPGGIDAEGAFVAKYDELLAEVMYSKVSDGKNPCELQGERANVLFSPTGSVEHIKILWRDGRTEELEFPTPDFAMYCELQEFIDMCRGKASPQEYNIASRQTMAVMDEIRRQSQYLFPADQ
ncbi:Gfo/Idh/MocA family oxidoreductase [Anaerolentibacter hominis]|uniref:Gfo/Idh/MocA family protein n=1 Tax=Anaerolentibacter hominis TaxID=3079009 RepID=UPI0031B89E4F